MLKKTSAFLGVIGLIIGIVTGGIQIFNSMNDESPVPTSVIDIAGRWNTSIENLTYDISQNGTSYHWSIPGTTESGPGRIKGDDLYGSVAGREVHYFVSKKDSSGRPKELRTRDPQYINVILFR